MSRSFARFIAGAALAAVLPIAARAQNNCIVVGSGNCTVGVTASLTIPQIAFLNANLSTASFSLSNAAWQDFLNGGSTDTTVTTGVALNVRANTAYTVALEANDPWSGGGWALSDVVFGLQAAACAFGDATTTLVANNPLAGFPGVATNNEARNLCLGVIVPSDLSDTRVAPGTYTLPLTLRITAP